MTEEQSLTDLENLVLAEIASASCNKKRRNRAHRPNRSIDKPVTDEGLESDQSEHQIARIHGEDPECRQLTGEEAELLQQPEPFDEPVDELPANNLFSPEEEAFMHRAVGFLSGREHGDVILGRIWEQLTERNPENYFDPSGDVLQTRLGSEKLDHGAEQRAPDGPDEETPGQDR